MTESENWLPGLPGQPVGYRKTATVSACALLWADTIDLHLVLPAERTKNRKGTKKNKIERKMGGGAGNPAGVS